MKLSAALAITSLTVALWGCAEQEPATSEQAEAPSQSAPLTEPAVTVVGSTPEETPAPTTAPTVSGGEIDLAALPGAPIEGALVSTESGLRYYDIEIGAGDVPPTPDTGVQVHYTGWMLDGTKFDSSVDRGEPADFLLEGVIGGWTEGVGSMRVGGKRKLVIPGNLGYGPQGNQAAGIPGNATLVFDVELLAIEPWIELRDPLPGTPVEGELIVSDTGLKTYDIVVGEGERIADADSQVSVHFQLYRTDGRKLADSTTRGAPVDMLNTQMFPGWQEGLTGMRVGGKRKLVVPWEIGVGKAGDPRSRVPPKATLIMDVELVDVDRWMQVPDPLPGAEVTGEFVETETGLRFFDLVVGEGPEANEQSTVKVNYELWLVDGTRLDGSEEGIPYQTPLQGIMQGWTEGVTGMRVGGKRKLIVPPSLGLGETGGQGMPPRATLIFDIELVEVVETE